MSNTSVLAKSTASDEFNWNTLDWFHINKYVETMQQRIYRAECPGDKRKVRDLQRILVRSKAMLLAAIKRVTQVNRGKENAGSGRADRTHSKGTMEIIQIYGRDEHRDT